MNPLDQIVWSLKSPGMTLKSILFKQLKTEWESHQAACWLKLFLNTIWRKVRWIQWLKERRMTIVINNLSFRNSKGLIRLLWTRLGYLLSKTLMKMQFSLCINTQAWWDSGKASVFSTWIRRSLRPCLSCLVLERLLPLVRWLSLIKLRIKRTIVELLTFLKALLATLRISSGSRKTPQLLSAPCRQSKMLSDKRSRRRDTSKLYALS